MFMLASSPLRKPRSKLTSAVSCRAIYAKHQNKASAVPTLLLSRRPFPYGNSGEVGNPVVGKWQRSLGEEVKISINMGAIKI